MKRKRSIAIILLLVSVTMASVKEKWEKFRLTDCCHRIFSVSSELNAPKNPAEFGKYGPQNLFDGNPATCWAEGVPDSGIGQKIQVAVQKIPDTIYFVNGYGKSPILFHKNNRLQAIKLICFAAFSIPGHCTERAVELNALKYPIEKTVILADRPGKQKFGFPFDRAKLKTFLRHAKTMFLQNHPGPESKNVGQFLLISFKIRSVYRGSRWNDTCLSELSLSFPESSAEKPVSAVTTNEAESTVFLKHPDGTTDTLLKDSDSIFRILELSPDKKWVILIWMPAHPAPGDIPTRYFLYNTISKKKILPDSAFPDIGDLYGFETKKHRLYLQYGSNKTGDVRMIDLAEFHREAETTGVQ
ncbi:MAG: hypothetical protein GXO69_06465 [Acidobacteria bacterium]|nr:hypothetical protein [Acidobacteriota bacterium]